MNQHVCDSLAGQSRAAWSQMTAALCSAPMSSSSRSIPTSLQVPLSCSSAICLSVPVSGADTKSQLAFHTFVLLPDLLDTMQLAWRARRGARALSRPSQSRMSREALSPSVSSAPSIVATQRCPAVAADAGARGRSRPEDERGPHNHKQDQSRKIVCFEEGFTSHVSTCAGCEPRRRRTRGRVAQASRVELQMEECVVGEVRTRSNPNRCVPCARGSYSAVAGEIAPEDCHRCIEGSFCPGRSLIGAPTNFTLQPLQVGFPHVLWLR